MNASRTTLARCVCMYVLFLSEQHTRLSVHSRCNATPKGHETANSSMQHQSRVIDPRYAGWRGGKRGEEGKCAWRRANELLAFAPDAVRHGSRLARNWRTARQRKLTQPSLFNRRDRPTEPPLKSRYRHHPCPRFTRAAAATILPTLGSTFRSVHPYLPPDLSQVRIDAVGVPSNMSGTCRTFYLHAPFSVFCSCK